MKITHFYKLYIDYYGECGKNLEKYMKITHLSPSWNILNYRFQFQWKHLTKYVNLKRLKSLIMSCPWVLAYIGSESLSSEYKQKLKKENIILSYCHIRIRSFDPHTSKSISGQICTFNFGHFHFPFRRLSLSILNTEEKTEKEKTPHLKLHEILANISIWRENNVTNYFQTNLSQKYPLRWSEAPPQ